MDLITLDIPKKPNKKVPSKFKQEFGSKPIEQFVTLSPKKFSFKYSGKWKAK